MASADFLLLTDLIYNKGWSVKRVTHNFNKETGFRSTLVLANDDQERELESSAEDFVTFAIQIQKTIDAKGEGRMLKVHDTNKYWDDIVKLEDTDGGKTRAAVQAILSGKFTFSFSPLNGIRKILQNKIPTTDPDVRGVKEHFFETFAANRERCTHHVIALIRIETRWDRGYRAD